MRRPYLATDVDKQPQTPCICLSQSTVSTMELFYHGKKASISTRGHVQNHKNQKDARTGNRTQVSAKLDSNEEIGKATFYH